MDDTQRSRVSDAAATRKRRSSILKSQRPARTPFSELEFNVATPTDTVKSRRVSFSRRTGVAEFVTNESTTTWKNFYEEHNKSLESSSNDSDVKPSRPTIGHLGKRIFDQQFEEIEVDFIGSLNPNPSSNHSISNINFTEQIASLECTSDGKLPTPQCDFEFSALPDNQSKLFGNDFTLTVGETTGRIDVNFSAIQNIGSDQDLDEIEKELGCVPNFQKPGPSDRHNLSECTDIDLNMTHVVKSDDCDMSITDIISSPKVEEVFKNTSDKDKNDKDWINDKENIVVNPYAAPRETENFAVNEESNQVLVFDGKKLIVEVENPETSYRQTLTAKASAETPKRKTIVINMNDDLPNFVEDQKSLHECSSNSSVIHNNIGLYTSKGPSVVSDMPERRRTIIHDGEDANLSITQALPSNVIAVDNINKSGYNISMTQALPSNIIGANSEKRGTIHDMENFEISMTNALPNNIMSTISDLCKVESEDILARPVSLVSIVSSASTKRRTVIFEDNDADLSITQALENDIVSAITDNLNTVDKELSILQPVSIISDTTEKPSTVVPLLENTIVKPTHNVSVSKFHRTVIFDENSAELSMTQAFRTDIFRATADKNRSAMDMNCNMSVTQALQSNIVSGVLENCRSDEIETNISMTQALPTKMLSGMSDNCNTAIEQRPVEKRRTTIYENADISMTQALTSDILSAVLEKPGSDTQQPDTLKQVLPVNVPQAANEKRKTIIYDDADISMTQALTANILRDVLDKTSLNTDQKDNSNKDLVGTEKRRTMIYDNADISMTQALSSNIISAALDKTGPKTDQEENLNKDKGASEKRRTMIYDNADISMTQALSSNIISAVLEKPAPVTEQVENSVKPAASEKRKTIIYDNADISMTQALSANILSAALDKTASNTDQENNLNKPPSVTEKRRTMYDNADISITQALSSNILSAVLSKPGLDKEQPENVETQEFPSNLPHGASEKRRTMIYDNADISMTQALSSNIVSAVLDDCSTAKKEGNFKSQDSSEKRRTIIPEGNDADISITEALPTYIVHDKAENYRELVLQDEKSDISMTQVCTSNILIGAKDKPNEVTKEEVLQSSILNNMSKTRFDHDNMSMSQANIVRALSENCSQMAEGKDTFGLLHVLENHRTICLEREDTNMSIKKALNSSNVNAAVESAKTASSTSAPLQENYANVTVTHAMISNTLSKESESYLTPQISSNDMAEEQKDKFPNKKQNISVAAILLSDIMSNQCSTSHKEEVIIKSMTRRKSVTEELLSGILSDESVERTNIANKISNLNHESSEKVQILITEKQDTYVAVAETPLHIDKHAFANHSKFECKETSSKEKPNQHDLCNQASNEKIILRHKENQSENIIQDSDSKNKKSTRPIVSWASNEEIVPLVKSLNNKTVSDVLKIKVYDDSLPVTKSEPSKVSYESNKSIFIYEDPVTSDVTLKDTSDSEKRFIKILRDEECVSDTPTLVVIPNILTTLANTNLYTKCEQTDHEMRDAETPTDDDNMTDCLPSQNINTMSEERLIANQVYDEQDDNISKSQLHSQNNDPNQSKKNISVTELTSNEFNKSKEAINASHSDDRDMKGNKSVFICDEEMIDISTKEDLKANFSTANDEPMQVNDSHVPACELLLSGIESHSKNKNVENNDRASKIEVSNTTLNKSSILTKKDNKSDNHKSSKSDEKVIKTKNVFNKTLPSCKEINSKLQHDTNKRKSVSFNIDDKHLSKSKPIPGDLISIERAMMLASQPQIQEQNQDVIVFQTSTLDEAPKVDSGSSVSMASNDSDPSAKATITIKKLSHSDCNMIDASVSANAIERKSSMSSLTSDIKAIQQSLVNTVTSDKEINSLKSKPSIMDILLRISDSEEKPKTPKASEDDLVADDLGAKETSEESLKEPSAEVIHLGIKELQVDTTNIPVNLSDEDNDVPLVKMITSSSIESKASQPRNRMETKNISQINLEQDSKMKIDRVKRVTSITDSEKSLLKESLFLKTAVKQASDTNELLETLSDFNDLNRNEVEKPAENRTKRLSFAPNRQSITYNREDLLNTISMAQEALHKSRIELMDDSTQISPEQSFDNSHSTHMSTDVVKTLQFDDESLCSTSAISDTIPQTTLKKTVFEDTGYVTENKAKVIPSYLGDVSDDLKQLMSDLVKPMADCLPFDTGNIEKVPSNTNTQVQANLMSPSQIDFDSDNMSSHFNPKIQARHSAIKHVAYKTYSDSDVSDAPDTDTVFIPEHPPCQHFDSNREHVIVFDHMNPLNNICLGPLDNVKTHTYSKPILTQSSSFFDSPPRKSEATLCGSDHSISCQADMLSGSSECKINKNAYVSTTFDVSTEQNNPLIYKSGSELTSCTTLKKNKQSLDQSDYLKEVKDIKVNTMILMKGHNKSVSQGVDARLSEVRDIEVNTEIVMKRNKDLLDSSSNLTLLEDAANVLEVGSTTRQRAQETVLTVTEMDKDKKFKGKKRVLPITPNKLIDLEAEVTPKPSMKIPRISNKNETKLTMYLNQMVTKMTPERDMSDKHSVTFSDNKQGKARTYSPKKLIDQKRSLTKSLDTSRSCESTATITESSKTAASNRSIKTPLSQLDMECTSLDELSSFTSSKHQQEKMSNLSPAQSMRSSKLEWNSDISNCSIRNTPECTAGLSVADIIESLPFMGSYECEWEMATADTWSFRLLHGRIRLAIRLGQRHINSSSKKVKPDTPINFITVEILKIDKKNPVANLCVKYACETMRYMVSRTENGSRLAKSIPQLLKRCAAVSRVSLRWGRAMHDAKLHLAYTLTCDGHLTLKVANIPLRSVWEVSMQLELVREGREAPWPRAAAVRVSRVVSDVPVAHDEVRRALRHTARDWGHAPRALWRIFRYLKRKTRDDSLLFGGLGSSSDK